MTQEYIIDNLYKRYKGFAGITRAGIAKMLSDELEAGVYPLELAYNDMRLSLGMSHGIPEHFTKQQSQALLDLADSRLYEACERASDAHKLQRYSRHVAKIVPFASKVCRS